MPVEISNRVWAVGDTHPDSDAARIDLRNDSLRIFVSRCDRADLGARRLITVHAGQGDEAHLHIGIGSLNLMDEIHPEFCPSQIGILLSHNGNIILLPAGNHASLTACAFI